MAKKGIVKQLETYGKKHPYISLALAGTFGYYFYESLVKPRMEPEGPNMYQNPAGLGTSSHEHQFSKDVQEHWGKYPGGETRGSTGYTHSHNGLGMTTSTSTTSSSSHGVPGMADGSTGEMSMDIDPTRSGMFGVTKVAKPMQETTDFISQQSVRTLSGVRNNPQSFLKYDQTRQLAGFSPSARRRVSHAGGSSNLGYSPQLDTQFENREAMMTGDLKKHEDILGFSGLMPLAGGAWYE